MSASVVGFYSLPFFGRIRPVYLETSMVHIILNSSVLLILSSALPILSRTLGEYSRRRYLSLVVRKLWSSGFRTRSDTNWAVQPQKMARGLKFRIWEVEGLYYLCSKNKGADQLRGYRKADLRLCFHICKKPVFS